MMVQFKLQSLITIIIGGEAQSYNQIYSLWTLLLHAIKVVMQTHYYSGTSNTFVTSEKRTTSTGESGGGVGGGGGGGL